MVMARGGVAQSWREEGKGEENGGISVIESISLKKNISSFYQVSCFKGKG